MKIDSEAWRHELGATGLTVTALAVGTTALGGDPSRRSAATEAEAIDTVSELLASPIDVLDTSNGYGAGESERLIGAAIAGFGGLPAGKVVVTKVDPMDGDYSGKRVRQSLLESLDRLGLDSLPLVHLHDPETHEFVDLTASGGAVDALVRLREEGVVGRIGLAGGPIPLMRRYLALGVFDVVLAHNRWTLVDRSAGPLFADADRLGIAVINAAVFGGGLLADPSRTTNYAYRPARRTTLDAVRRIDGVCTKWRVSIATAALQFSLLDPRIGMTVVGVSRPGRLPALLDAVEQDLPAAFWDEVEAHLPASTDWLEPTDDARWPRPRS